MPAPPRPAAGNTPIPAAQIEAAPPEERIKANRLPSRRTLIQAALIGGAGIGALPLITLVGGESPSNEPLATNLTFSLNSNWLFGGQYMAGSESSFYDDSSFAPVTMPHTVTPLSWRSWNDAAWQQLWIYRRHFNGGQLVNSRGPGNRIMVDFDGVMVNATVVINDKTVSTHQGGYLPFSAELTGHVTAGDNLLSVLVDANIMPVPPMSFGRPATSIDFFQPGGIYRDVRLRVLPQAFLSDLFARPADVLTSQPRVDVECTIDSALPTHVIGTLLVDMLDGNRVIATQATSLSAVTAGISTVNLSLTGLEPITLWSPENPKLYTVRATLQFPGAGSHTLTRKIGFREASFQPDGFYLNGERLQLFGLNRHQLYPYAGMAMPARVQRKDALVLKNELNCNMVRCSHYPQSPHFLDACDELGLLVWEEAPGWHNVDGSPVWQDMVVQNVRDMVIRDRSRPSVVIWGTRLNETPDLPGLWAATRQAAAELDSSRPSSGAMAYHQVTGWDEDVFAYNDYSHDPLIDTVRLRPPLPGLPYLVSEAVGVAEAKPQHFAWTDPPAVLANQAVLHSQAHSLARSQAAYSGLVAWAGFDYASPEGLDPESVKWAGVADLFRVPKPGAAIYQSQLSPNVRAVIVPVFFWETGGIVPPPDPAAMIASNCERLEIFINGAHVSTGLPAAGSPLYRNLAYPPFLVNLPAHVPAGTPELLIEGYVGSQQVTELRMSSDLAADTLALQVDDPVIVADGSDATRAVFRAVDTYGNQRRYPTGVVTLTVDGPATLIGDNPFAFGAYGGLGAVWIRSLAGQIGAITLAATEPGLGQDQVKIQAVPAIRGSQLTLCSGPPATGVSKLAKMRSALTVSELSPAEFTSRLDQLVALYAAAMRPPPGVLPGRRGVMIGHATNPGFCALLATVDGSGEPAGFTYGFHGRASQWWHDTVARAVAAAHGTATAAAWLDNSFEVAELHVAPEYQGHGLGASLLLRLASDRPERTALLSTRDADTPARRLYRGVGFTDLLTRFVFFPSGDPPYAVMGAELPLRGLSPRPRSERPSSS